MGLRQDPSSDKCDSTVTSTAHKLRKYHELAKDVLDRAHKEFAAGRAEEAVRLYHLGEEVVNEALALDVPSSGLGPAFSNTASWQSELVAWLPLIHLRLQQASAGNSLPPCASIPAGTAAEGWAALRKDRPAPKPPSQHSAAHSAVQPLPKAARRTQQTPPGKAQNVSGAFGGGLNVTAARAASEEAQLREVILAEVLQQDTAVKWADVAGLATAKQALQEMVILPALRQDLFQGLRAPARGLLLYGPPGNGKTLLAKALASEAKATFFSISASSLTSKWYGEGEKLVRTLFDVARAMQPSIIFMDEIDSILSERSSGEHDAGRRLKTEFLVQFDGVRSQQSKNSVVVIGATNRPWDLDEALRRRLQKRVYIPLPDSEGRRALLMHLLDGQPSRLSASDLERLVSATGGYSGSDLSALCREAAMAPLREWGPAVAHIPADRVRPLNLQDFTAAVASSKPSVGVDQLRKFETWTHEFGSV